MSAPDPRANPILLGHEAAERTLLDAMHLGRMHHAWLVTGPEGIGKATLAFRFARRLLAGQTASLGKHGDGFDEDAGTLALDPAHPVFRRVVAGGHADMLTVERAYDEKTKRLKRDIAVKDVREINSFMALTPAEGGWRVAVVDGAEELNQSSANALLKILEEPPSRAVLILVCSTTGRLLPTIRSRCRHLRLASLPDDVMARLLAAYLPERSQDDRDRLITLAEGSIGRALAIAEEDGITIAALVDKLLESLPNLPLSRGYEVADALGRNDAGFRLFTDQLITGIAALVRDTVRGRADPEQQRLAALRPLEAWGEVWQGLLRLQGETERFALDKRQALVSCVGLLAGRVL
jgi:DNA polymerase III subunit delta'